MQEEQLSLFEGDQAGLVKPEEAAPAKPVPKRVKIPRATDATDIRKTLAEKAPRRPPSPRPPTTKGGRKGKARVPATPVVNELRPQPLVSELAKQAEAPVEPGEPYMGWPNSATYLADLYLSSDAAAMESIAMHADPTGRITAGKLASMFKVVYMTEEDSDRDDYMTGIRGGNLVVDYWRSGTVDFQALATFYTQCLQEQREDLVPAVDVMSVLGNAVVEGNFVRLTSGQIDRDIYTGVDKVLRLMGGHWDRKLRAHRFEFDPSSQMDALLQSGHIIRPDNFDAFFTPPELAATVARTARIRKGMRVLDPNAGSGALLKAAAAFADQEDCFGVEIQPKLSDDLRGQGFQIYTGDFLSKTRWGSLPQYDRILLNPPFSNQADIDHVLHAWSMLARAGRLVAIMAASVLFRQNKKTVAFRSFVEQHNGTISENPEGSFKSSGTSVRTVTVVLDKPEAYQVVHI